MKTRTFILFEDSERMFAEHTCRTLFNDVHFLEYVDQSFADKEWISFSAADIKPEYERLSCRDLAFLLEAHALAHMENLLWGHHISASALCSEQGRGEYLIRMHLNAGYTT